MTRTACQVLIFPYRQNQDGQYEYAVFQREPSKGGFWQGISGGVEDGESEMDAARREAFEEAGIPLESIYIKLDSRATIPVYHFSSLARRTDLYVVPEFSFGVAYHGEIVLSDEHTGYRWLLYQDACEILKYDSNRTALWELNERLGRQKK